jgi:glycine/D-amino acid oxidase-like deaminating enzyme
MFRFNDQMPVTFTDDLPDKIDVVVIGGGVIGVSTAWYLLQHGLSVLVCDKGRIAGEQSSRNWGWVRAAFRDPGEAPIVVDSQRCWKEISESLDDDTGFRNTGTLMLTDSDEGLASFDEWLITAKEFGIDSRPLSPADITKVVDLPGTNWSGGVITPGDCRAEPFQAVPAIAKGVQQRGGLIREQCAVRTLDVEGGQVTGVVTESGTVKAQAVVCAAGAWSNLFLSNLGITFPQLLVRNTVVRTESAPNVFDGAAGLEDIYIRRRLDGGYTVASGFNEHTIGPNSFRYFAPFLPAILGDSEIDLRVGSDVAQRSFLQKNWDGDSATLFEQHRVLNPAPARDGLRIIRRNLTKRVPQLAGIEFAESWAGMIDATPDIVPVMDNIESHPGLFLASGFSGHGFGIGPGAGKVMANLIAGKDTGFDLSRFRFARFADGSKMVPGPAL